LEPLSMRSDSWLLAPSCVVLLIGGCYSSHSAPAGDHATEHPVPSPGEDTETDAECGAECYGWACQCREGCDCRMTCETDDELRCDHTCATSGTCDGTCTNGECTFYCGGGTCESTCDGGGCLQICAGLASCEFHCRGGGCEQRCEARARRCQMFCEGGGCLQTCARLLPDPILGPNGPCLLDCVDRTCVQQCSVAPESPYSCERTCGGADCGAGG